MSKLAVAGRIIFALPFAAFGLGHLTKVSMMATLVPVWVPGGGMLWVYITGIALIAAAVSIMVNRMAFWACMGLALLMFTFVAALHIPNLSNPQMAMMAFTGMLKDTALGGAALFMGSMLCKWDENCQEECNKEDSKPEEKKS